MYTQRISGLWVDEAEMQREEDAQVLAALSEDNDRPTKAALDATTPSPSRRTVEGKGARVYLATARRC